MINDTPVAGSGRHTLARRLGRGLLATVLVAVLGVAAVYGYLAFAEWRDPSGRVFIQVGGQRRYLEQPMALVAPRPAGAAAPVVTATAAPAGRATGPAAGVPLPPQRLVIPTIGVDVPIILADNDHLPQIKAAGWLFRSAFPATAGNTVLLGQLDGNAGVFGRLREMQPGDEIHVGTEGAVHVYVIDTAQIVDNRALEALAPTAEAVVTLITYAGNWNAATRSYDRRLVVRGHYAAALPPR